MKAHVGADAHTRLVHSLKATAANTADVTEAHALLHGDEAEIFADAGYQGADKRAENTDCTSDWHIAMKRNQRKRLTDSPEDQLTEQWERLKAKIRAKVEHPFHVVKNLFGHRKVRYRGLAKNEAQLFTLFGMANLLLGQRYWQRHCAQAAP